jgi:glycosyltransferase involved in cell wall biosynthesis
MVPFMLAAADVCLVVQKATVTDTVIPSKLLTYMASGLPIVASVHCDSETARRIREANCGVIVPPEDPNALVKAVEHLRTAPAEAQQLGCNGRAYVEKHFAKEVVLGLYDQFLAAVFPKFGSA